MTTPATSTTSTSGTAAAGSAVLGPDPARTSSTTEVEPADTAAAVEADVDVDGPPLPTVAVYRDKEGREHYASPFSPRTRDQVAAGEWEEVDGSASPFDPTSKRVRDVVAYLEAHADDQAEVDRVKAAEAAGENRPTIRDWTPDA